MTATNIIFTLPTANTDGTALPTSAITGIKVGVGTVSGKYTKFVEDTTLTPDANGQCTFPISALGLGPGTYFVALQTDSVSQGVAEESVPSNEVSFVIPPPPSVPNPPSAVSVA